MARTINAQSVVSASALRYAFIRSAASSARLSMHRAILRSKVARAEKAFASWSARHARKVASVTA